MQAQSDHHHSQQHSGHVAHITQRLNQGNTSNLPVITQHDGSEEQTGIEGQQVRIRQNPGEREQTQVTMLRKDGRETVEVRNRGQKNSNHTATLSIVKLNLPSLII